MSRHLQKQRSGTLTAPAGRIRGKKPIVNVTAQFNQRVFKAYQDREYQGPELTYSPDQIEIENKNNPLDNQAVFLGADGTLYDIYYNPIQKGASLSKSPNGNSNEDHLDFQSDSSIFKSMPQPSQFDSYLTYEQALLDWKAEVEQALGYLRLPLPVGRNFYRPKVVSTDRARSQSTNSGYSLPVPIETEERPDDEFQMDEEELLKKMNTAEFYTNRGQFIKMIEKRKGNNDLDSKKFIFPRETWDAVLVPQEPDPSYYDTYEEYEAAMKHWAALCTEKMPVVPPHAKQLKDLIPIQLNTSGDETGSRDIVEEQPKEKDKDNTSKKTTGSTYIPFFPIHQSPVIPPRGNLGDVPLEKTVQHIGVKAQEKVNQGLESMLKSGYAGLSYESKTLKEFITPQKEEYMSAPHFDLKLPYFDKLSNVLMHNRQVLPLLHGSFPKPWERGNAPILKQKNTKSRVLRRQDLTAGMISASMDCSSEIDGKRVEFRVPEFDLETIDITKLNDIKYIDQCKTNLRTVLTCERNDELNSWYHPSVNKEFVQKHRNYVESILNGITYDKITIEHFAQVIQCALYLDKFQDFCSENMKEEEDDGIARTYLQGFVNAVTPDNFHQILRLFDLHESKLAHAKISWFVSEVLQSAKSKSIIEKIMLDIDINHLSYVAYAMSFFADSPLDVFPFNADLHKKVISMVGKQYDTIIQSIYSYYYISIISNTISKQPFIFVAINQVMIDSRKSMANTVFSLLSESSEFLSSVLWSFLGHRSSTISSLFLFLLVQIMGSQDANLQSSIKSDSANLLHNLTVLSTSKFSHVQFAVTRVMSILSKDPNWLDYVYTRYSFNIDLIYEHLTAPRTRKGEMSIITQFALDISLDALTKVTEGSMTKIAFLLDETFFWKIFKSVTSGSIKSSMDEKIIASVKNLDDTTEILTRVLAAIAKAYFKLNTISATTSLKNTGTLRKRGNLGLCVSPQELQKMIYFIAEASRSDNDSDKAYFIRRNMLAALRQLMKVSGVFELVKKENDFYSKLLTFCRDCPHYEFNKEAWLLLYQILEYHTGSFDLMKGNFLSPFLECIGTNSPPVIMQNGLHFLAKVFSMPASEAKKLAAGKNYRKIEKEPLKSFEKDIKSLGQFYVSHTLFIKVHMIYKKLVPKCAGPAFLELAKFYEVLWSHPYNTKNTKEICKNSDYKTGLEKLHMMFHTPMEEVTRTSGDSPKPIESKIKKSWSKLMLGKQ